MGNVTVYATMARPVLWSDANTVMNASYLSITFS